MQMDEDGIHSLFANVGRTWADLGRIHISGRSKPMHGCSIEMSLIDRIAKKCVRSWYAQLMFAVDVHGFRDVRSYFKVFSFERLVVLRNVTV